MSVFDDITVTWKEDEFKIKAKSVFPLICKVEEIIKLSEFSQEGGVSLTKLSLAYQAILEHAGCKVDVEEVYSSLFNSGTDYIQKMVILVATMMVPPTDYNPKAGGKPEGK